PLHRPGRRREPARLPRALHRRPPGHGHDAPGHGRPHARAALRGPPPPGPAPPRRDAAGPPAEPLFEALLATVPAPRYDPAMGFQLRAASLDWDDYVGRLIIGRVTNGTIRATDRVAVVRRSGAVESAKVTVVYVYDGLRRVEVAEAGPGELVAVAGV